MRLLTIAAIMGVTLASTTQAEVITVSNNPNSPGQYTSLQAAIDAAQVGDTIYVHGSQTTYGAAGINKRLTLIGAGYSPVKDFPFGSTITSVNLDSLESVSGASGTKLIGFNILYSVGAAAYMRDITLSRNSIGSGWSNVPLSVLNPGCSGWVLTNNVISYIYLGNSSYPEQQHNSNWLISNNVITGTIAYSNQPTVTIANNLFVGGGSAFNTVSFAVVANNVFYGKSPGGAGLCSFNNNITYQTDADALPYGTNTGAGNITSTDPQFESVSGTDFGQGYDYRLSAGSPGKNAGTDGMDIGAFGGGYPLTDLTGTPAIPQIKQFVIENPVIPEGGQLNINFKAKKQN